MDYIFREIPDEALLAGAQAPIEGSVALAMLTTGYDVESDEAVAFAVVDASGRVLFDRTVKPHNRIDWQPSAASGFLGPQDVEAETALYEHEDEIIDLVQDAPCIVCQHLDFLDAMFDRSWIALPKPNAVDLCELFRQSHATPGHADEPATVATLESICCYYGLTAPDATALGVAQSLMRAYRSLIAEFAQQRDAKGQAYWDARAKRLEQEAAQSSAADSTARMRERRMTQMNALLWISGGIIFTSLVIQLAQRGADIGLMVVAGAAAIFSYARGIVNWRSK